MTFSFPISLDVTNRRCVVVGGGAVAEQKTRSLVDAGAMVTVIAPDFTAGLEELARRAQGAAGPPGLVLVHRAYEPGDLEEAFLAIAATDDGSLNGRVFEEAERRKVLMNAVDDVEHCNFAFPSIVRRGDLLLAISTGGKAPALAKHLRRALSEQLGPEYGVLVDLLAEVRAEVMPRQVDFDEWAGRWERALEEDLVALVREGRTEEVKELVRARLGTGAAESPSVAPGPGTEPAPPSEGATGSGSCGSGASASAPWVEGWQLPPGSVSIVGAGPGDPDLITVRGRKALDAADVVVHDRLVHPSLLEGKRAIFAGKQAGGPATSQEEINELLVRLAREGLRVVRLKGGDPFVFGRGAEEAEALARAGIDFEIVPGTTSAIAGPAYAGIPVTDRRHSSSVAFVTGHRAAGPRAVDWAAMASAVETIVVLMGIRRLGEITTDLQNGGLDPETPAAAIEWATTEGQRVVTAAIGRLAEAAAGAGISSPALVVIGDVVALREQIDWFRPMASNRPAGPQPT